MSISNKGRAVLALGVLVILLGAAGIGAVRLKDALAPKPVTQPLAFNHKHHMDEKLGLSCEACHKGVEEDTHASIPAVATCVKLCHTEAQGTHPDEPKLREYAERGEAIPWNQANKQPGHVHFSHVAHVKWAKLDCKECHGDMKVKEEPVTLTTTHHLDMDACMKCHKEKGVSNDCLLCHK